MPLNVNLLQDLSDAEAQQSMNAVNKMLTTAEESGLQIEVVTTALKELKTDPDISIVDACAVALNEWIK